MFDEIAFYPVAGKPLLVWLGVVAFVSAILTYVVGYLLDRGSERVKIRQHKISAILTALLMMVHAILSISVYFF